MRRRVVCGLSETIATLPPQSAFTSVDLPTFGRPATATTPDLTLPSARRRTSRAARLPSPSLLRQVPRLGQQLPGTVDGHRPVGPPEANLVEAPLVQPLPAAAAGRGGDRDRLHLPRLHTLARRLDDRRPLGADPERVGGVLDVRCRIDPAVPGSEGGADAVARVGRVGVDGGLLRRSQQPVVRHRAAPAPYRKHPFLLTPSSSSTPSGRTRAASSPGRQNRFTIRNSRPSASRRTCRSSPGSRSTGPLSIRNTPPRGASASGTRRQKRSKWDSGTCESQKAKKTTSNCSSGLHSKRSAWTSSAAGVLRAS